MMRPQQLKRWLYRALRVGGLAYVLSCLGLYLGQRALLYHPPAEHRTDPAHLETLLVPGAALNVSVHQQAGDDALIYFGGNAEDVSQSLADYAAAFPDHAIYMLHYRGYGGSTGTASEESLHADALALYERVRQRHSRITVIGRSLGSGVAIHLAARQPVERLLLVTPYDSILNVAQARFPAMPVRLLLKDKFESWRDAPQITVPTLLLVAGNDDIIPSTHAAALLAAFRPGVARLETLPDTDHNSIADDPEYLVRLAQARPLR